MTKKYINQKGETIIAHFIGENVQYGVEGKGRYLLKSKDKFLLISKDWVCTTKDECEKA